MDFAFFSGDPDEESRIRDANCFLVETNCPVIVTFDGTPLTNVEDNTITLPTTYWIWESLDVNDIPLVTGLFGDQLLPPYQLIPVSEIGYIGDSQIFRRKILISATPLVTSWIPCWNW